MFFTKTLSIHIKGTMSSQFNITEATRSYAMQHCTFYSPTTYGQIKYAISCLPADATSSDGIQCNKPNKLPNDVDCDFMISGGWNKVAKRAEEEPKFYCYTVCQELRSNNAAISSSVPTLKISPTANASTSPLPTNAGTSSSQSAALTVYPNFVLSFFTLLFFMFVFFKPRN